MLPRYNDYSCSPEVAEKTYEGFVNAPDQELIKYIIDNIHSGSGTSIIESELLEIAMAAFDSKYE